MRDSQRRSRMLAAAAFEGLGFLHEGLFDDCNEQMTRLLGGRRRELLKTPFLDCVAPEHRPAVTGILTQGKCGPCEFTALRRDGTAFAAEMQTRAAVIGGKAVRVVAVRDIGERKRAEEALRASEARLSKTTENAPAMIYQFLLRPDGSMCFPFASGWCQSMFGVNPEALRRNADALLERILPEDRPAFEASVARSAQTLEPWRHEFRLRSARGDIVWHQGISTPELQADGSILWSGIFFDTTERRRAEEALRCERNFADTLVQSSPTFFVAIEADGKTRMMNQSMLDALGYHADEVIGADYLRTFVPERDRERLAEDFKQLSGLRQPTVNENWVLAKDGRELLVEWHGWPVFKGEGVDCFFGVGIDITERKRAVEVLQENRQRLEFALQGGELGIWDWIPQTGAVVYSVQWAQILGYQLDEVRPDVDFFKQHVHPDDLPSVLERLAGHLERRLPGYESEHRMRTKSGQWKWILDRGKVVERDLVGRPLRVTGVITDISRRKRAEAALERERLFTNAVLDSVPGLLYLYDDQGRLLRWNKQHETLTGYSAEELAQMKLLDWYRGEPNEAARIAAAVQRIPVDGHAEAEALLVTKSGQRIPFLFTAVNLRIDDRNYFVGIGIDVAERRRAEAALRENEERLRLALAGTNQGLYDLNLQTGEAVVSPEYVRMLGYESGEVAVNAAWWRDQVHPDDSEMAARTLGECLKGQRTEYRMEYRLKHKSGGWRWVLSLGRVVEVDAQGQPVRMLGTHTDVTERHQAEEALRRSEAGLEAAQAQAHIGNWSLDLVRGMGLWSKEMYRLCERDPALGPPSLAEFLEMVHPADRAVLQATHQRVVETGEPYRGEFRARLPDGSARHFSTTIEILEDRTNHLLCLAGTLQDITERKQAEEALAREHELLRTLIDLLPDGIYVKDRDSRFLLANRTLAERLGKTSPQEVVGLSDHDLFPAETADTFRADEERVVAGDVVLEKEEHVVFPNGLRRTLLTTKVPLRDKEGRITGLVGVGRDITERVLAEAAARETQERLGLALEGADLGSWDWNAQTGEVSFNERWAGMIGYRMDEIEPHVRTWERLVHPEDMPRVREVLQAHLQGRTAFYETEHRMRHKTGDWIWVLDRGKVVNRDAAGKPLRAAGTHLDITERKRAERALQESEGKLRSILRAAPTGIGVVSNRVFKEVNERICAMTGYAREELLEQNSRILYPSDEDYEFVGREKYRQIKALGTGTVETRWKRKDGSIIEVLLSSTPIDETDWSMGVTFTAVDITERQRAAEELFASRQMLRTVLDTIPTRVFWKDRNLVYAGCNRAFAQDHGFAESAAIIGKTDLETMTAVFAERYRADDRQVIATGQSKLGYEEPQIRADGQQGWLLTNKVPMHDSRGQVVGVLGTYEDITERKRIEAALRESEERFRQMFERNRAMMLLVEPEGGAIADANPAAAEFYGYPRGVLCRMGIEEINTKPRDQVKVAREAAVAGEMEDFVFPHRLASGEIRTVEVRSSPVNVGGRRLLFSIIQDITERKRAEAALEKRIVALTQPLDSPAGIAFEELFNLADIQRLQDLFAEACAVASIITHPDGTPITRPSNFCKLCSEVIRKTDKGLKNCYCSDAILGRQHEGGPTIQPCLSGGLWDAGVSITVGGRHVANWLIGQVRNEAQSEDHMMAYAREIGADETAFREAFRAVPVMSRERFEQVAQALFAVASQLSTSAYQNVQQARFIAERKRAEDALAQERELLATVINLLPDSVYVKDRDCRFLLANQTLITRLGKSSPSEVLGLSDRDFFPPEEAARFRTDEEPVLAGEVVSEQESRTKLPTGVTLTLLNTKVPLRNRQGEVVGLVGVGRDITERKRVEEEREHLIRELEAKNAELERFTYTVSHDLKSPLITIKGFAGALLQDVAVGRQERVQHDLQRIAAATDKMADLLKDLLELSRIGRMMNPPTDVKLDKLVTEVLELLAGIIQQRPIRVTVQPGLPTVRGDRRRLTEVFQNLIENAVRFLGDQAQPCIEIGVRGEGVERVFFVRDNGMGIEPRYHETVFGLFNKLDARTPGTGIGLALVRRIVEVHGGRIWVESAGAGQGATFCFTLAATPPIRKDTQA